MRKIILNILLTVSLVLFSFLLGERAGRHAPITVEVINAKPNWWGYNRDTRQLTVGLGDNTNPANNASYTFEP